MTNLLQIFLPIGVILIAFLAMGLIFSRLYQRASKETSFVRTGLGGQLVVMNGGALVFPVLHETISVNMNTLRLEVRRANEQALITRDRMRVDVLAEFYVRVQPTGESIANAAQTLGRRTLQPQALKELVEGKFVDALRAVAAEMTMEALHEQRVDFVQKVQRAVSEDLLKNGLELESVSLTGLDQTNREFFNPDNAFDAAGLTKLTQEIEERRKLRNAIEQDTRISVERKNLEAEQFSLSLLRDREYAQLEQAREVETRRAMQKSEIAREQAQRHKEAQEAEILADQSIQLARIQAAREIEQQNIDKERHIRERDIERERSVEVAEQEKTISIAKKSEEQSLAQSLADQARAAAVKAEEEVTTVRETQRAERQKAIELIEARRIAERDAIGIQVRAESEKIAADDEAEAIRIRAEAEARKTRVMAEAEAAAEMQRAQAAERRYAVDAAGRAALNDADNRLSAEIVQMRLRLALIEQMRDIIRESVRPLENIESIKILQVDGFANGSGPHDGGGSPSDQIVQSALKYRAQAPLIDSLLKELGFDGAAPAALASALERHVANEAGRAPARRSPTGSHAAATAE
jgi:uncharacterized membrane protein YqiK